MVTASLRRLARKPKLPPAPFELELPDHLRKTGLEHLARSCGLKIHGNKPVVRRRLCAAAAEYRPLDHKMSRVLSIDMGIRNFGFAMLSLPAPRACVHAMPMIHTWKSLALDRDPALLTAAGLHAQAQAILTSSAAAAGADADTDADDASPEPPEKFEFSPAVLSQIATHLVHTHLLPLRPTHVLIENQRYRTVGSTRIHEWTLRVNMLEAMLYSTFETLKSVGKWDGTLVSVLPQHVAKFLAKEVAQEGEQRAGHDASPQDVEEGHEAPKKRKRKSKKATAEEAQQEAPSPPLTTPAEKKRVRGQNSTYQASKRRKLDLLAGWLDQGTMVGYGNKEVEVMAHTLLRRRGFGKLGPGPKDAATPLASKLAKLDDVADCLLQTLVWLRWHDNLGLLVGGRWETVMARSGMHGE